MSRYTNIFDFPSKSTGNRPEGRGGAESSRRERLTGGRSPRNPNIGAASRRSENHGYNHGVKPGFTRIPRAREGGFKERLQFGRPAFQSVHGNSFASQFPSTYINYRLHDINIVLRIIIFSVILNSARYYIVKIAYF